MFGKSVPSTTRSAIRASEPVQSAGSGHLPALKGTPTMVVSRYTFGYLDTRSTASA
ncbi:hypothetical protein FB471_4826 [Amycolatopsis cihanbeyliensis]|uniref:Uncharacterized protein n=1 Tax=Amycolatopsis cihanbeyliensis TaxID=1128664 RepID=A0A542DPH2_AMYCI|nr:hypothetical protein FB471_4826 [Amycolatopsis cihanbeyliensis]